MPAHPHTARRQPPEKHVEAGIIRDLRAMGYHVSKLSQPRASMQTEGLPDLYVMGEGHALWVEVKNASGRLREAQRQWHERARRAGVPVCVARSTADVVAHLIRLGAPLTASGL